MKINLKTFCIVAAVAVSIAATCYVFDMAPHGYTAVLPREGNLFSPTYPANRTQQQAMFRLRTGRRLSSDDEFNIRRKVSSTAQTVEMPEAILGCTLFLQSDLNRLDGVQGEQSSRGMGRLFAFDAFLLSSDLERYSDKHGTWFRREVGDAKGLLLDVHDTQSANSYFATGTAVTTTALLLHDRYLQLKASLDSNTLRQNPDLLWIESAIAYANGTRLVLALWNELQRSRGRVALESALNQREEFAKAFFNRGLVRKALARMWPSRTVALLEDSYISYVHNLHDCAIENATRQANAPASRRRL